MRVEVILPQNQAERKQRAIDLTPQFLSYISTPRRFRLFTVFPKSSERPIPLSEIKDRFLFTRPQEKELPEQKVRQFVYSVARYTFSYYDLIANRNHEQKFNLSREGDMLQNILIEQAEAFYKKYPQVQEPIFGETPAEINSNVRILRAIEEESTTLDVLAKKVNVPKNTLAKRIARLQQANLIPSSDILEVPEDSIGYDVLHMLVQPVVEAVAASPTFDTMTPQVNYGKSHRYIPDEPAAAPVRRAPEKPSAHTIVSELSSLAFKLYRSTPEEARNFVAILQSSLPAIQAEFEKGDYIAISLLDNLIYAGSAVVNQFLREFIPQNIDRITHAFAQNFKTNLFWANGLYSATRTWTRETSDSSLLDRLEESLVAQLPEGYKKAPANKKQAYLEVAVETLEAKNDALKQLAADICVDEYAYITKNLDKYPYAVTSDLANMFMYASEGKKSQLSKKITQTIAQDALQGVVKWESFIREIVKKGENSEKELSPSTESFVKDILTIFHLDYDKLAPYWKTYLGNNETYAGVVAANIASILWLESHVEAPNEHISAALAQDFSIHNFRRHSGPTLLRQYQNRNRTDLPEISFFYRNYEYRDYSTALNIREASRELLDTNYVRTYEMENGFQAIRTIDKLLEKTPEHITVAIDSHGNTDFFQLGFGKLGYIESNHFIGKGFANRRLISHIREKWKGRITLILGSCNGADEIDEKNKPVENNIAQTLSRELQITVIASRGASHGIAFKKKNGEYIPYIKGATTIVYQNGEQTDSYTYPD